MAVQLSERLTQVASMVSPGSYAADVGCDHGFVSIWLVQNKICPGVIAMDVRKGPLAAAAEHIREAGLSAYIETRLSDGVEALREGEAETLILAGMGGRLMLQILEAGGDRVQAMRELILQPQSEIAVVRRSLRSQGFAIAAEKMVFEEGKYYPMFRVLTKRGLKEEGLVQDQDGYAAAAQNAAGAGSAAEEEKTQTECRDMYDAYGKLLLQEKHPVLYAFLKKEEVVCGQIAAAVSAHAAEGSDRERRLNEVRERQRTVQTALQWYDRQGRK